MTNIGIVVILYNPDIYEFDRVLNSYNGFDEICIVDNSEYEFKNVLKEMCEHKDCVYIDNEFNKGIAHALNVGCCYFVDNTDFDWVLTLDQDTILPEGYYSCLQSALLPNLPTEIAILSPMIKWFRKQLVNTVSVTSQFIECTTVISSGSLLRLSVFEKVGGYNENLFIDGVDNDFCYRLRLSGYKIFQFQKLFIDHQLGDTYEIKFFGRHFTYVTNHNYIRKYYIVRNSLFVYKQYHTCFHSEMTILLKTLFYLVIKVILFEKDKLIKIKSMMLGYVDYKNNKYGKLDIDRLR